MAAEDVDLDAIDDDKWLYGDDIDGNSPEPSDAAVEELLNEGIEREGTPDLDEIEAASGIGQNLVLDGSSTIPEQLKSLQQDSIPQVTNEDAVKSVDENGVGKVVKEKEDQSSEDEDDDDDDVKITIGAILNRPGFGRIPQLPGGGAGDSMGTVKKVVDLNAIPQLNGVPIHDVDLEESIVDKPWRKPGSDITDYFNYGFTEDTWRLYCEKQRKMRHEVTQLNKLAVTTATAMTPMAKNMFGFPMMEIPPPHAINPAVLQPSTSIGESQDESENAEEKRTPPPEADIPKIPILPPPGLPPSLPFPPPQDVTAAAAMAAMFTGGPPPPMRPPDFHHGFPPPIHGAIPHFPPPIHGELRPPFLPPGFSIGTEPRGPISIDDPRVFNPEMGFPPHWDPHTEMIEYSASNDYGRGSRSPSRSSSNSSRGSSVEHRSRHSSRRKDKYERSHHRSSRRSRSRERSHHRSSRRDHRDRDRERDRERERRSERHEKERRERRRREERRHERISKRHRSRTPDDDDQSTRDKKRSRSRSAS